MNNPTRYLLSLLVAPILLVGTSIVPAESQLAVSPKVVVLPGSVEKGDWITVVGEHLSPPVDRYCVYFDSPLGPRPLAHFVPPGYGEQISPLIPGADPATGIGSYQTWMGVSGAFHLSVAQCSYGAEPKAIRAVAQTSFTIGTGTSSSPPFGLRAIGDTPLGSPFRVTLAPRSALTCLFVAPEDVFGPVSILPGVPVRAGAGSARLAVPTTHPWGVYQILRTKAGTAGACPSAQLRPDAILASGAWAPGRSPLRMESEGVPAAGSGLAIHFSRALAPDQKPQDLCLALWSAGRFTGVAHTAPALPGLDGLVRIPLPRTVTGEVTIAATNGVCPGHGPPTRVDAYTVTAISARSEARPVTPPLPLPTHPSQPLRRCPAVSPGPPAGLSPARGDPRLVYSTYLGHGPAQGMSVALDGQGNAYIALGRSFSNGCLVKLAPDGGRVLMALAIPSMPRAIAIDRQGAIWLAGGGEGSGFVDKLSPNGKLLFRIKLGTGDVTPQAMAIGAQGSAYITGSTFSTSFPTTPGAYQRGYRSSIPGCPPSCKFVSSSAFVVKLSPDGRIAYSTYFGSSGNAGAGIAVDNHGTAYISSSSDPRCPPGRPSLSALDRAGRHLLFTACQKTALPGQGPGLGGPVELYGSRVMIGGAGFVTAMDLVSRRMLWIVPLHSQEGTLALAVDSMGGTYVTGFTASRSLAVVQPIQAHLHGGMCGIEDASHTCTDAFVAAISPAGKLLFSSYLGGSHDDAGQGIAVIRPGRMLVTGYTASTDFPISRALQPQNHGGGDANSYLGGSVDGFVTEIQLAPWPKPSS